MSNEVQGQLNIFGEVADARPAAPVREPVARWKRVVTVRVTAVEDGNWKTYEYEAKTVREAAARYRAEHPLGTIKGLRYSSKISVGPLVYTTENF